MCLKVSKLTADRGVWDVRRPDLCLDLREGLAHYGSCQTDSGAGDDKQEVHARLLGGTDRILHQSDPVHKDSRR